MSFVEDVNRHNNERRAEEGRQANVEHMAEMAQKAAADALIPKNAVKDTWDKRQAKWPSKNRFCNNLLPIKQQ